jgi:outer membrane protein
MTNIKLFLFFIIATISFTASAQQLKIAYINSQQLLEKTPEAKTANDQLLQMANELDSLYQQYIMEYQKLANEIQTNTSLSAVAREAKMQDIGLLEQRIQQYEQESQQRIDARKKELYQPVIEKLTQTIKDVAKENGYTYVIDNSLGVIISAPEGDDILPLVQKKLNIQ